MVRSLLLLLALLLVGELAFSQVGVTVLAGKITDDQGEALLGATVKIMRGADLVRGTQTDFNGNYRVNLDPGNYDVEVSYSGYQTQKVTGVRVISNTINTLDFTLSSSTVLSEVVIKDFKVPLIEQDKTSGGQTLTSEQIRNLPTRSVNAIVATTAGTTSIDGGAVNIRGSRSNATNYYIDGIRVAGTPPPVQDIEQLQVVTGGLGAEYGDVTGGIISITTKGPADVYHGTVEVENSYGLDPYGWFLGTANVSGPLIKRKGANGAPSKTILGFRASGQFLTQKDDRPSAVPVYRVKDELLDTLINNPLIRQNGILVPRAETYTRDSVNALKYRPYEARQEFDFTGRLDLRLSDNMDFSLTGTYRDVQDQFTPGGWRLLNSHNNPTSYGSRYRTIARFRHRLGGDGGGSTTKVGISNVSYTLQFGFERGNSEVYDPRHRDRIFEYGYIGRFNFEERPIPGINNSGRIAHVGNLRAFTGYEPGPIVTNPGLIAYNQYSTNPENINTYFAQNGIFSTLYNNIWSNMHTNVNQIYNVYRRSESDIITAIASANFDLKLGRVGTHSFQFGLLNEQRVERSYSLAPFGLWNLMRQLANGHFNGLDTNVVIGTVRVPQLGIEVPRYANAVIDLPDFKFYRTVRQLTGQGLANFVNTDALDPRQLSLSMFSSRELLDQGFVDYYGYDHTGRRLTGNVTFNDFFTARDADGIRTFPVAPLRPLYQAAFLQDKFVFNKMIFRLGLRIERFDLNTKVLRDPFSLYEIMGADEFYRTVPGAGKRPGTIGDDYKVYVTSSNDRTVKAFRNGETWFFADGTQAPDGNVIFGGGVVTPYLRDTIAGDDIFDVRYNPNTSFQDYTPQVNWLPRLAFSFPISEDANFFAHYDILVQRPPSNWEATPLDYLYFYVPGRTPANNPNLLPERVVDYEVGFQQRITQNSAIKFSAYYRELRDMIQRRTLLYIPTIGSYDTYGNIDFGTVKGFTFQYDLRRVQNAELRLAYTLQFADGTGSDANSQRGLTQRGNLRTLFPLSFDERHNIQGIFDYRFDTGKRYNGPRIAGKDILALFGVNVQFSAVSGRPYTARQRAERFGGSGFLGSINGSRLPWRTNIDLRVDKTFELNKNPRMPLSLNVYLRVANLLNTVNIISVYPVSGSPYDDGYLATAEGQSVVQGVAAQGRNVQAYLDAYSWAMLNPGFFTIPRRIYVGAAFQF
ncbi:MAG: carboxypeptidase regulatory-like domain-containing protein [Saprospiraceae bacterium]|nr:carboxypeptidase regulatory-like domain-containing protein [Saprospiraceae bacterium]MDW8228584.1 carboxypeptidase regulatory-like domain-containing protein [Saprospiraceae bacterium]